ncbi:hypothetical protein TRFO_01603 [Tritrichomonas foetus]|uniref:Uncharacterized protein n=1 Tax=Tritrichomonas foetus TaxID=1144522 RepID=A0A1J4JZF7_9EUKA|nr:hypothetical protein TRFO_01603 [Tritrichomonas foetus]|eukprot:OHT03872.1 hypothetical protein TRFO_01603 [Tritrichomonas foetus]
MTDLIEKTKEQSIHEKVDPQKWEEFISQHDITLTIHDSLCIAPDSKIPWKWRKENDRITVFLYYVDPSHVTVDETKIESPKLFGNWWAPIENIKISFDNSITTIEFTPKNNVHFPVLIRGGPKVDPHSMFFLGLLSNNLSKDYLINWLASAAELGEVNAQSFLGRVCLHDNRIEEAVHWLARNVLEHAINRSSIDLSIILIEEGINPLLAENLLCGLCSTGNVYAFVELGKLYLHGCGEIMKRDVDKGIKYLTVASEYYHNEEAKKELQNFHKEHPFGEYSWEDIAISSTILVGSLACSYFLLRKFIKRRK